MSAKRFTDTGKWDKAWFRKLDPISKCVWLFLCDKCDHAGIWDIDEDAFRYFIGEEYTIEGALKVFRGKIEKVGDKLIILDFIDFQYSTLNPENRVHKSVIERLEKAKKKVLISPLEGAKDKDKEKDKVLEEGCGEKPFKPPLQEIYAKYPRKEGKARGLTILAGSVKTLEDFEDCQKALAKFLAHHKRKGTEAEFFPHFKTWAGSWRDCLDPDYGEAEDFSSGGEIDWASITGEGA